ncbi:MAG: GGDEF domain-containing protein [Burkholderiaceae bacterium]|nr:GGDEF domain-containing protein [Burkholderiaceae bacterium]
MSTSDDLARLSSRYADPPERAAEYLRLAVQGMTRQPARPDPVAYTVWYEHVAGRNPALSAELVRRLSEGGVDDEAAARLFHDHVLAREERAAREASSGMQHLLDQVGGAVAATASRTQSFGAALGRWADAVDTGQAADPSHRLAIQDDTRAMQAAIAALQARLDEAGREAQRLRAELAQVHDMADSDALTGLPNRRCFERRMAACLQDQAGAHCLLLTDIDHFKKVNDSYGHLFGDQVLRSVARGLQACLDDQQLVARVGGEEFAIMVPAPLAQAAQLAERIRLTVAGSRIRRRDGGQVGQITVSLGVAARRPNEPAEAWFERADRALYAAKHGGRNRVQVAA